MRQDFYNLSCQVEHEKENLPADIAKFLPTPNELDWINRAIKAWNKPTASDKLEVIKCPEDLDFKLGVLRQQLGKLEYKWAYEAKASWEEPTHYLSDSEKQEIYKEIKKQTDPHASQLTDEEYESYRYFRNKDFDAETAYSTI
ncbi:unnamed protein product [Alternaria alternata]